MKKLLAIATSMVFVTAAVHAQTLSAYQSVINGQSPMYYNTLDNTLAPSTGTGTFSATAGSTFTSDYFGNANDAVTFAAATDQLLYGTGANIINASGDTTIANQHGSMSLLFETPATIPSTTIYLLSNGDAGTTGQFSMSLINGLVTVKVNNKTSPFTGTGSTGSLPTLTASTWYYVAMTWDLNGVAAGVNGVNFYLGQAGAASLSTTAFFQRGGTGNFSSAAGGDLGNGGAFSLSGHQLSATGGFQGGVVDELATFNTELTSGQINSQFAALVIPPVPEPSAYALLGMGVLLFVAISRFGGSRIAVKNGK